MSATTPMPLPPRLSRAAVVARELEESIVAQERRPGDRIATKDALRERFGVAVATINEAVRLLETRGVIEARPGPGGGIFVARPSVRMALMHTVLGFPPESANYREYLVVRDALEPLVCRDAASAARASDVADLQRIVARMERHLDDPPAYFRCNWELHRRLARMTTNAPLRNIYLTLLDYLESMLADAVIEGFDGRASVALHRELIAAVTEGPGPRLEAAIAAHAPFPPRDLDGHELTSTAGRVPEWRGSRP
ncbi:MAG: FadR/GntR family transcriptional regulator [Solirubrobacteraceae bacterium]